MKKACFIFSCLLLVGCHQESNNTKTTQSSERIQTSRSSNISSQEESKDYSDEGMLEGMNISSPRESSYGTVILACGAANGAPGGFAIEVYSTSVKNPKRDHSDSSQSRLIAGQQFIDFPAEAYYYRE